MEIDECPAIKPEGQSASEGAVRHDETTSAPAKRTSSPSCFHYILQATPAGIGGGGSPAAMVAAQHHMKRSRSAGRSTSSAGSENKNFSAAAQLLVGVGSAQVEPGAGEVDESRTLPREEKYISPEKVLTPGLQPPWLMTSSRSPVDEQMENCFNKGGESSTDAQEILAQDVDKPRSSGSQDSVDDCSRFSQPGDARTPSEHEMGTTGSRSRPHAEDAANRAKSREKMKTTSSGLTTRNPISPVLRDEDYTPQDTPTPPVAQWPPGPARANDGSRSNSPENGGRGTQGNPDPMGSSPRTGTRASSSPSAADRNRDQRGTSYGRRGHNGSSSSTSTTAVPCSPVEPQIGPHYNQEDTSTSSPRQEQQPQPHGNLRRPQEERLLTATTGGINAPASSGGPPAGKHELDQITCILSAHRSRRRQALLSRTVAGQHRILLEQRAATATGASSSTAGKRKNGNNRPPTAPSTGGINASGGRATSAWDHAAQESWLSSAPSDETQPVRNSSGRRNTNSRRVAGRENVGPDGATRQRRRDRLYQCVSSLLGGGCR
ncbi:unnamed protein product [Amoebophrya sp. A120]|nr:unnamed protein product [Amoebophrya sp. A120]|eukprot:GSA120T00013368001.1